MCRVERREKKREKEQERLIGRIQTILRVNEEHPEALHVYGMAMRDLRKISDAVKVFLKILILSPSMFQLSYPSSLLVTHVYLLLNTKDDKAVKEDLAELLQQEGGLSALYSELAPTPSSAPAYAYIGTFIKEFGGITTHTHPITLTPSPLALTTRSSLSHGLVLINCNSGF